MIRNNFLLLLFLMGWNVLPAQSLTLDSVAVDLATFQKHYVYPSVLRALALGDSTFIGLIKDVELVRILRVDSAFIESHSSLLSDLNSGLDEEGYEAIGSFYEKGSRNELFVLERKERIEGFVVSRIEKHSILIIELIGDLHLSKINDLMNMDLDNFSMLLDK